MGFLDRRGALAPEEVEATMPALTSPLGNDGSGTGGCWLDASSGTAIGHSPRPAGAGHTAAARPIICRSGRLVLAFSATIYDSRDLRGALEGRGVACAESDETELLLEAIEHLGIEKALPLLDGMFALALWDRATRQLTLVRDRAGKKPLYCGQLGQRIVFASELRALRGMRPAPATLDPVAIEHYLRHGWIAAPRSIFREMRKLPAASRVTLDARADPFAARPSAWWSALDPARRERTRPFRGSLEEATDRLDGILGRAVEQRMNGASSHGATLSGGIDSSLVVALMQRRSAQPVHTFTVGFDEPAFNEADHAASIAAHLGTRHRAAIIDPSPYRQILPDLPAVFDEPFADVSAIPNIVLARMAATVVGQVLTGEGGDEAFPGFKRYGRLLDTWTRLERLPLAARRKAASMVEAAGHVGWRSFGRKSRQLGKLARRAQLWDAVSGAHLTRRDLARIATPAALMRQPASKHARLCLTRPSLPSVSPCRRRCAAMPTPASCSFARFWPAICRVSFSSAPSRVFACP